MSQSLANRVDSFPVLSPTWGLYSFLGGTCEGIVLEKGLKTIKAVKFMQLSRKVKMFLWVYKGKGSIQSRIDIVLE